MSGNDEIAEGENSEADYEQISDDQLYEGSDEDSDENSEADYEQISDDQLY